MYLFKYFFQYWFIAKQVVQDNDYDVVEEVEMNDESKNDSNRGSGSVYEKNVVENPYYDGGEILNPANSVLNVTENPYYEGLGEEETNDATSNIIENPYDEDVCK